MCIKRLHYFIRAHFYQSLISSTGRLVNHHQYDKSKLRNNFCVCNCHSLFDCSHGINNRTTLSATGHAQISFLLRTCTTIFPHKGHLHSILCLPYRLSLTFSPMPAADITLLFCFILHNPVMWRLSSYFSPHTSQDGVGE